MTDAERVLWRAIRRKQLDGHRFRRQQPIGRYIVDFFCPEVRLIVELDGGQHAERADYDADRTEWLEARGYRVVRYWNPDALRNLEGVLEDLRIRLRER